MPLKPLVTAGVENLLNTFLYRSPALKSARTRLQGTVLRVDLKGFSTSLVLVFSERQVDVLGAWEGEADCTVITYASVLPKLRDRQQLTTLIRSGELEVQGDIQVVQNFVALADLAELDPAELLAPYT
ncbi:ubiquinone biosynthesis accessory factor UbiJ, partial [Salmonella enterica]|uniref:ubiquinone biosynthesis accessory factor UbiJ n=1 Tax=Salmonella enterica TaxID=28901 RepID=UPI003F77821D|nr:ubiquinone biosynthesis protein UbiJ [Salmonella enterica subsp. enterica serovar Typhimurium]